MNMAKILDGMAVDYGTRPSDLIRSGLAGLAFDVAVRMRTRQDDGN